MADQRPYQNQRVAFTVIDEDAILVHPQDSSIYFLNDVASRIWLLADGQHSVQDIAGHLCQEFQVAPERALNDVEKMIDAFVAKELISLREGVTNHVA